MMYKKFLLIHIFILYFIACEKELDITDFSSDFSFYNSELRIEALMLPAQNTAIVRIDKSVPLDEASLYNCIDDDNDWNYYYCSDNSVSYESLDECTNECNSSNCLLHLFSCEMNEEECDTCSWDLSSLLTFETKEECIESCSGDCVTDDVGEDGKQAYDSNNDGDYDDRGFGGDIAPDEGEGDGVPGCNELNVDEYNEILPEIHLSNFCTVNIKHGEDVCEFIFSETGGMFFDENKPGFDVEDIEAVSYGAWIPDPLNCDIDFNHYDTEYLFSCECEEESGYGYYGKITAADTIRRPVIFYTDTVENNIISCSENPSTHSCLESFHNSDTLYFEEGDNSAKISYVSLIETIKYQAVQYIFDEVNDRYVYYHGHRDGGTDSGNNIINNSICLMSEKVVAEKYPPFIGSDKFKYDIFTFSKGYENYYFFIQLDLLDPERTNLRDENGNPVMGAFGAMSGRTKYFQILSNNEEN